MTNVLERLSATVAGRAEADTGISWTARLLASGPEKCAEKFGEEAVEAVIEAVRGDAERLAEEAADVLYHLVVMLRARGLGIEAALSVLERREGRSGIEEKASR